MDTGASYHPHVPARREGGAEAGRIVLLIAGVLTGVASLLHVGIIFGGPPWYRFFGAGERMALLAARGAAWPTLLTAFIALTLGIGAAYAVSGAGDTRRLPLVRVALVVAATLFLVRGVFGVPVVLLSPHPYAIELRARMTFMTVTSIACLVVGACYAIGVVLRWRSLAPSAQ